MRKTDKKLDRQIQRALTEACETALAEIPGFEWITHLVDYQRFPQSLSVVCVFATMDDVREAERSGHGDTLRKLVRFHLRSGGITLPRSDQHIRFDSEDSCQAEHNGNWKQRLTCH